MARLKYDTTRKGTGALVNRDIDKALKGSGMSSAVSSMGNRARNTFTRRAPVYLRGATSVSTTTRNGRKIAVVQTSHPAALAIEFGSRRNGGRGRHTMAATARELNR